MPRTSGTSSDGFDRPARFHAYDALAPGQIVKVEYRTKGAAHQAAYMLNQLFNVDEPRTLQAISRANLVYVWREPDADLSESLPVRRAS